MYSTVPLNTFKLIMMWPVPTIRRGGISLTASPYGSYHSAMLGIGHIVA